MHCDISQPVDTVFNSIDDLSDTSENANSPMTEQQMVDLACVIFAKQSILQPDLRLWNRRPVAERTHANLTQHLRDAQTDLSSLPTAGDVCHQQPAHQANMAAIADLVLHRLLDEPRADPPSPAHPPTPPPPPPPPPAPTLTTRLHPHPYSDTPGTRVRLPRDITPEHPVPIRVSGFGESGKEQLFAGYFFIANGGVVANANDVRTLAFDLTSDYAYYLKVQVTSSSPSSGEELVERAASLLDGLMGEIMRCSPDWVDVETGRYPEDNPRREQSND